MSLFGRITGFFRDIRITAAYPAYEMERRREHVAEGGVRFSSAELEARISELHRTIEVDAKRLFDDRIEVLKGEIGNIDAAVAARNEQITQLERNFEGELDQLDVEIHALNDEAEYTRSQIGPLKDELEEAYDDKKEAYVQLEEAKREIERWHRKVGRNPRDLPEHSLFGQSMGDLYSLKDDREEASQKIGQAKEAIASLKSSIAALYDNLNAIREQIDELRNRISEVRRDRSYANRLLSRGVTVERLESEVESLTALRGRRRETLAEIRRQRDEYIRCARSDLQVDELEEQIAALAKERQRWNEAFDLEERRQARMQEHRLAWLRERGLA